MDASHLCLESDLAEWVHLFDSLEKIPLPSPTPGSDSGRGGAGGGLESRESSPDPRARSLLGSFFPGYVLPY